MYRDDFLLEGLKREDEGVYRLLFDTYYLILVGYVNSITQNAEASKDIVQDCLVDFWYNKRYEKLNDGLDKYLIQMAKHAALNYQRTLERRDRRHQAVMDDYWGEDEEDEEEMQEKLSDVYLAINGLPEERRKIFLMVVVEGKKYREVAELCQLSINTVKTQMTRAFAFIRGTLRGKYKMTLFFFGKIIFSSHSTKK